MKMFDTLSGKTFRSELRQEVKELNERIDGLEADVKAWKGKYYEYYQKYHVLKLRIYEKLLDRGISREEIKEILNDEEESWLLDSGTHE